MHKTFDELVAITRKKNEVKHLKHENKALKEENQALQKRILEIETKLKRSILNEKELEYVIANAIVVLKR